MKNLNRWVYAIIGVITLLLAGLVYAWSVMSKSIVLPVGLDSSTVIYDIYHGYGIFLHWMSDCRNDGKKSQSEDLHYSFRNFIFSRIYACFHNRCFTGNTVSWFRYLVWSWCRIRL